MTSTTEVETLQNASDVAGLFMRICKEYQRVTWPLTLLKKAGVGHTTIQEGTITLTLTTVALAYDSKTGDFSISLGNYNEHTNYGLPMAREYVKLPMDLDDIEFTIRSALATVVSAEYIGVAGTYIDDIVNALLDEENEHVALPFGKDIPEHLYDINFLVDYMNHRIFV